jgi:hypothetical protein
MDEMRCQTPELVRKEIWTHITEKGVTGAVRKDSGLAIPPIVSIGESPCRWKLRSSCNLGRGLRQINPLLLLKCAESRHMTRSFDTLSCNNGHLWTSQRSPLSWNRCIR